MIKSNLNYQGQLLVANPFNPSDNLEKSVILVISYNKPISLGLQLNKPMKSVDLMSVCKNLDIEYLGLDPLYHGGVVGVDKVHVVHSSDWSGLSTIPITSEISVTSDISVLVALSRDQGPEYFRACAGYYTWSRELLENQLGLGGPARVSDYSWETVPATLDKVFDYDQEDQWIAAINSSVEYQASRWFF